MPRDMNLFRDILLQCEEHEHGFAPDLKLPAYTDEQVGFHVHLLGEADLLRTADVTGMDDKSPMALPTSLTNAGYNFLGDIKPPEVWEQTQSAMAKIGGWSLRTLVKAAEQISMHRLEGIIESIT